MNDEIERREGKPVPRLIRCPRCHADPAYQGLMVERDESPINQMLGSLIERLYYCDRCKSYIRYRYTRFNPDGEWTQDVAVLPNAEDRRTWSEYGVPSAFVNAADQHEKDRSGPTSDPFEPPANAMKQMAQAQRPNRLAYSGITAEMDRQAMIMREMGVKPYMVAVSQENHDVLVAAIYDVVKESGADEETRRNALHYWTSHQLGHVEVRGSGMLKLVISDDQDVLDHKGVMLFGERGAQELLEEMANGG